MGREPAVLQSWTALPPATKGKSKTTYLKYQALWVGKGMAVFPLDMHALLLIGYRGVTETT